MQVIFSEIRNRRAGNVEWEARVGKWRKWIKEVENGSGGG